MTTYENKKTRKEDIKADLDSILEQLAKASESVADSDLFQGWLRTLGKFHRYSFRNCILIGQQCEGASQVAGFQAWKNNFDRTVRKGEKAIWILAPMVGKEENQKTGIEESKIFGFRTVPVYDISQTDISEGKEDKLADLEYRSTGDASEAIAAMESFVASKGWNLEYIPQENLPGAAKGCSRGGHIQISDTLNGATRAGTLAHEIGHELLHWIDGELSRDHGQSWREVEAESVSFAVMQAFGIEQASEFYLASWGGTVEIVKQSMTRIQKAVHAVLDHKVEELAAA